MHPVTHLLLSWTVAEAARLEQSYFVRWRAAVTTKGEVGPQGPGTPALLVREVLELRPAGDDDCEGAPAQPAAD